MNRKLQGLFLAVAMLLTTATFAQNIVGVFGTLAGTQGYPVSVHVETVQNTLPYTHDIVVTNINGYFGDTLNLSSSTGWIMVWFEDCDSNIVSGTATYTGNSVLNFTFNYCQNNMFYDCNGVLNGPDMPGTPCDDNDPNTINDTWTSNCACVGIPQYYDCLGVLNGPDMPGAPCDDGDPNTGPDFWDSNCFCVGDSLNNQVDCLGVPGGNAWPGTPCDDNDPNTFNDLWSMNCVCIGDSTNVWIDCNGVVNGPDVPGASCDDGDPNTSNDTWDANCNCAGVNSNPCDATFDVVQAYDSSQGQIPFEVWAYYYNNNVFFSYNWDFGDGTFSTDPYPTHTYSGNGPYLLCLTITGNGCQDTYCDTVQLDPNGILVPGQGAGFTLNIFNANALGVEDVELIDDISIVPNPVNGPFDLVLESKESVQGTIEMIDLTGRVLSSENIRIQTGANRISMNSDLRPGTYLIRLTYGDKAIVRTIVAQ